MDMIKKTIVAATLAAIALPVYAYHDGHHRHGGWHHGRNVIIVSDGHHNRHHHSGYWVRGHWKFVTVCGTCRKCGCYDKKVWIPAHWVRW